MGQEGGAKSAPRNLIWATGWIMYHSLILEIKVGVGGTGLWKIYEQLMDSVGMF